jgi:hypothetical protein
MIADSISPLIGAGLGLRFSLNLTPACKWGMHSMDGADFGRLKIAAAFCLRMKRIAQPYLLS